MSYNTERQTQNELTSEFKANSCTQTHGPSDPEAEWMEPDRSNKRIPSHILNRSPMKWDRPLAYIKQKDKKKNG